MAEIDTRYEQTLLAEKPPKVDREQHVLHGVHLMGPVSKHGYRYDIPAMEKAASRFEGMCVGINHDYTSGPLRVQDVWGEVCQPITVNMEGAWGDVAYIESHPCTPQILEAAERSIGNLGMSAVTAVRTEQNKVVTDFTPTRLDLVIGAATTKSLFEQADMPNPDAEADCLLKDQVCLILDDESNTKAQLIEKITAAIDAHYEINAEAEAQEAAMQAAVEIVETQQLEQAPVVEPVVDPRFEQMQAQIAELTTKLNEANIRFQRYEQFVAPEQKVVEVIEKTTKGIDLAAFWNDAK